MKGKIDLPTQKKKCRNVKILPLEKKKIGKEKSGKKIKHRDNISEKFKGKIQKLSVMDRGCKTPIQKLMFSKNVLTKSDNLPQEVNITDGEKILMDNSYKKEICQKKFRKLPPQVIYPPHT